MDQEPSHQIDALKEFGCEKVFSEKVSSVDPERPKLKKAIEYLRPGDTLIVWKLSHFTRSITQIINTVKTPNIFET